MIICVWKVESELRWWRLFLLMAMVSSSIGFSFDAAPSLTPSLLQMSNLPPPTTPAPVNKQPQNHFRLRPFDATRQTDKLALDEICKDVFGGTDYLPQMASAYALDPSCQFFVLTTTKKIPSVLPSEDHSCNDDENEDNNKNDIPIAIANLRVLSNEENNYLSSKVKIKTTYWLEGVRVHPEHRNQGIANFLLTSMLRNVSINSNNSTSESMIQNKEQEQNVNQSTNHGMQRMVLACTIQSNIAMQIVFDKLGMTRLAEINMISNESLRQLPGWTSSPPPNQSPGQQHQQNLIAALGLQEMIGVKAREQEWNVVTSESEMKTVMNTIQCEDGVDGRRSCGFFPGLYEILSKDLLNESIQSGRVFWSTTSTSSSTTKEDANIGDGVAVNSSTSILALVRDERITSLRSNWILSVCGTTVEGLQEAVWWACYKRPDLLEGEIGFSVAFDGAIPTNNQFCSALPLTQDKAVLYSKQI